MDPRRQIYLSNNLRKFGFEQNQKKFPEQNVRKNKILGTTFEKKIFDFLFFGK